MNWNELKIPSFLVPRPRQRSEKGYGDENGDVTDSTPFSSPELSVPKFYRYTDKKFKFLRILTRVSTRLHSIMETKSFVAN